MNPSAATVWERRRWNLKRWLSPQRQEKLFNGRKEIECRNSKRESRERERESESSDSWFGLPEQDQSKAEQNTKQSRAKHKAKDRSVVLELSCKNFSSSSGALSSRAPVKGNAGQGLFPSPMSAASLSAHLAYLVVCLSWRRSVRVLVRCELWPAAAMRSWLLVRASEQFGGECVCTICEEVKRHGVLITENLQYLPDFLYGGR